MIGKEKRRNVASVDLTGLTAIGAEPGVAVPAATVSPVALVVVLWGLLWNGPMGARTSGAKHQYHVTLSYRYIGLSL